MKTAKLIRGNLPGFSGEAALYELSEPVEYTPDDTPIETRFVIASAVVAPFSGPETYLFPATKDGAITDWGELHGSMKGTLSHLRALEHAGFTVT